MNAPDPDITVLPILFSWALVLIPLAWGVCQSVATSLPLLQ